MILSACCRVRDDPLLKTLNGDFLVKSLLILVGFLAIQRSINLTNQYCFSVHLGHVGGIVGLGVMNTPKCNCGSFHLSKHLLPNIFLVHRTGGLD
jgi:hypothetical protein